jgi:hypothetical protein
MRRKSLTANPASPNAVQDLEHEIARIAFLNKDELRALWRKTKGQGPPEALSKDLIARVLAQALQEVHFGGLAPNLRRQLAAFADGRSESARYVKTGSIIVREYQGQLHEVVVVPEGFFWAGQTYHSLSVIAREITGTTWNGPRFFGLLGKGKPAKKDVEEQKLADKQKSSSQSQSEKIVRRHTSRAFPGNPKSKGLGKEELHGEGGI